MDLVGVVLSVWHNFDFSPDMPLLEILLIRMTDDAFIAGDAYPGKAPVLTPMYRSSCDSMELWCTFLTFISFSLYLTLFHFENASFHTLLTFEKISPPTVTGYKWHI